jgi:hypothetical protein
VTRALPADTPEVTAADVSSYTPQRDGTSRLLADCAALGHLVEGGGGDAASRLERELGPELVVRLVAALGARGRVRARAV